MTVMQMIIAYALLGIFFCFSIVLLITALQSLIFDQKREKREKERLQRELEYHKKRMELLEK